MRDQLVQYDIDHGSIFDAVTESTQAHVQQSEQDLSFLPATALRAEAPILPRASELQAVRHFTRLSQKNFSIDTNFYPLGSCTMKYNPRVCNELALAPGLVDRHPLARPQLSQGFLSAMYDLQEMLSDVSGLPGVALSPMAGAQGEYAGVAMIRAYHMKNGDEARTEIIVPDAAHGTNPATAVMCGFKVKEIPTLDDGDVDIDALKAIVGPQTAGIMLTNPSTVGVFERKISEIAKIVHDAGGLLYYDGANLNAILGHTKPGDMGFDVMHMNLHKTFSTPHGGGGPGAGSIAVGERLLPFMPTPIVIEEDGQYRLQCDDEREDSIGQLSAFAGNAGVLIRAYVYMKLLGDEGMRRVGRFSSLNANYLMHKLKDAGFQLAYPTRRASHEFIVTLKKEKSDYGLTALDVAKGLLDYGFHAPTTYFPIHVPECLLIEPTETESKAEIDKFVDVMVKILDIAKTDIEHLKGAPWTLPNRRFDEVKAVKELNIRWQADA